GVPSAPAPPQSGPDVDRTLSPSDTMYTGNPDHYFGVGASALGAIRLALGSAGLERPTRVLDYACGHGRVLRWIRAAFPEAALVACDLDRAGVDFCATTFGAAPVYGDEDPGRVDVAGPFDLIWSGSLLTHLPERLWAPTLTRWSGLLSEGGVLVFTTHGRRMTYRLRHDDVYGQPPEADRQLLDGYAQAGFGYVDYPGEDGYGLSVSSPAWVVRFLASRTELRLVFFAEAAWDGHQDVAACVRDAHRQLLEPGA
ncbi:MAG: class I SAM-dependent methyltransferase, partial [Actinomycetota bacterium]